MVLCYKRAADNAAVEKPPLLNPLRITLNPSRLAARPGRASRQANCQPLRSMLTGKQCRCQLQRIGSAQGVEPAAGAAQSGAHHPMVPLRARLPAALPVAPAPASFIPFPDSRQMGKLTPRHLCRPPSKTHQSPAGSGRA